MTTVAPELDLINSPAKLVVADFLKRFSDETTLAEIAEEITILANVREGLLAAREGRVKPHDEFKSKVQSWFSK